MKDESKEDKMSIKDKINEMEVEPTTSETLKEPESILVKIITAESPDKNVIDYEAHPLNFDRQESTGRIIRGLEGITGNLDRAVVDIMVGVFQKVMEILGKGKDNVR